MSDYYLQMSHGIEGPYTLAQIVALSEDGLLDDETTVSQDQQSWELFSEFVKGFSTEELAGLDKSLFVNCPRCDDGVIEKLRFGQKLMTILVSLALVAMAIFVGYAATKVVEIKMLEIDGQTPIKSQWPKILLISLGVITNAWYFAQRAFSLNKKWWAWIYKICPWCEEGFIRRGQASLFQSALYFIDAFFFKEVLFPIYKTLTYQWLWRSSEQGTLDEDDENGEAKKPGFLKTMGRVFGFTFVIFGAVPFLWAFSAENSTLGLGFSVAIVFVMFRLIFAKNAKNSAYRKGIVFLMLPMYFVSMVELIRWCLLLTLKPGDVPPDISDLYLKGLDTLLTSSIFMGIPKMIGLKLSTLKLASTWKSLSLTGITVFFTKLVLNAALIVALVKSFTLALYSTRIYRRTGERGVTQSSSAGALAEVEELTLEGSPVHIEKVTEGLQAVASTLAKSKAYVKSVASAAEPDSDQQKAALKALNFIENEKLDSFIASDDDEEEEGVASEADTSAGLLERLVSMVIVGIWFMLFVLFFAHAIETAVKREIADLLNRASQEALVEKPLKRRMLYAKVLDKDPNNHSGLRLAAATDMDIAAQRVNLLDMDEALIDIDRGFAKMIHLQKLTGLEDGPYNEELRLLGARAYALRGRVFFFKNDPERAVEELRKERTRETRRLLFALALDKAAKNLLNVRAAVQLKAAKEELGIDEEYAAAHLVDFANAVLTLRGGTLEKGQKMLGTFLIKQDEFSKEIRQMARYLRVRALLQLNQLKEAEKEIKIMIEKDPEFGPIYLEYGHLLRRLGKTKEALKAYDKASLSKDEKVRDHGLLAGVLLSLQLKRNQVAADHLVKVAKNRETDALFHEDATLFLLGQLDAETLISRSARWGGDRHKAQMALARLMTGIRALAQGRLGISALEFRRVFAQVETDSAEAEVAAAFLDEIQIRREGRSYQAERFYHKLRLQDAAKLIRKEIRSILFAPDQIVKTLSLALKMDDEGERSRAVAAVANGKMVSNRQLLSHLVDALDDKAGDTRLAALEALSENPFAEEAKDKILKAVKDKDERVRRAAVRVMEGFSGSAAVEALSTALNDTDRFVRRDAAYALAKIGSPAKPALESLMKRLDDDKIMVRDAAFAGVKAQGEAGAKALLTKLGKTKDSYVSIQTVQLVKRDYPKLLEANMKDIITFIITVLTTDKDPASRRWAAQNLARLRYDKRVADEKILSLVRDQLRTALEETTDPAVGVALATCILQASRSYGIDGSQAVKHFVNEFNSRPALRDTLIGSLLQPGVDEAAVPIIDGMLENKTLIRDAQRLLRSLLLESKRKKQIGEEAIKQLKKHLENEDNEEMVDRATDALAVVTEILPAETTAPVLVQLLKDPSKGVRTSIGNDVISFEFEDEMPESIKKELRAGTASENEGVRVTHFAMLRDQSFEDESLIPGLKSILESEKSNDAIRAGALWAASRLPKLRDQVIPQATAMAAAEDDDVASAAMILLLSAKGPRESLNLLAKADVEVRAKLLRTLEDWLGTESGEEKGGEAVACLIETLRTKEDGLKTVALETLTKVELEDEQRAKILIEAQSLRAKKGEVGETATKTLLALAPTEMPAQLVSAALKGEDSELASKILDTLNSLAEGPKAKKAAEFMVPGLLSEDESIQEYALDSLSEFGVKAHSALQLALKSGNNTVRVQALNVIAKQRKEAAILALDVLAFVDSNRPKVARAAVRAIGLISTLKAEAKLRSLARRAAPRLKAECWIALGRLGAKDSGREIEKILEGGGVGTRAVYLARSLVEVDRSRGLTYLMGALRTRYGRVPATIAAKILGDLGGAAKVVRPDLRALIQDRNPQIKAAALAALAKIG